MAKLQAKFNKWLEAMRNKDAKARPYYIAAIRHWDEGDEFVVIAFNQNNEKAEEIYNMMYGVIVMTEPFGKMDIINGLEDLSFIDNHKVTLYDPRNRWHC